MEKVIERIKELINPILEKASVELYSCTFDKIGKDTVLSILIDNEEGISLDKCIEVNELISKVLDKEDLIKEAYMLEVASAGAEKPLTTLEHYKKNIDKYILVQVKERVKDYDELVGYLREVKEDSIILEIKIKTRVSKVEIKLDNISLAMTSVDI